MDTNPLLILATIASTLIAALTQYLRWRDESKSSQAQVVDLITDSARDTITMLNDQAKEARDARLVAEQRANRKEAEKLELQRSNAGLVHEVKWLRDGTKILSEQLVELGKIPEWDAKKTKPLLTTDEVEELIGRILQQNGYAK